MVRYRFCSEDVTIPKERAKGHRRSYVQPLSDLALAVLRDARQHANGAYILTNRRDGRPLRDFGSAWQKNGERSQRRRAPLSRVVDRAEQELGEPMGAWVIHDLRRTVRSHLSQRGIAREIGEAVLNHAPPGLVGTYDLYKFLPEKRQALDLWAKVLSDLGARAERLALPAPLLALPAPETV
jgi:integrase